MRENKTHLFALLQKITKRDNTTRVGGRGCCPRRGSPDNGMSTGNSRCLYFLCFDSLNLPVAKQFRRAHKKRLVARTQLIGERYLSAPMAKRSVLSLLSFSYVLAVGFNGCSIFRRRLALVLYLILLRILVIADFLIEI